MKVTVRFRGREITHPEIAKQQLEIFLRELDDLVNVEQNPTMEGRNMAAVLSPKPQVMQRISQERAQREKDRGSETSHDVPSGAGYDMPMDEGTADTAGDTAEG